MYLFALFCSKSDIVFKIFTSVNFRNQFVKKKISVDIALNLICTSIKSGRRISWPGGENRDCPSLNFRHFSNEHFMKLWSSINAYKHCQFVTDVYTMAKCLQCVSDKFVADNNARWFTKLQICLINTNIDM